MVSWLRSQAIISEMSSDLFCRRYRVASEGHSVAPWWPRLVACLHGEIQTHVLTIASLIVICLVGW